MRIKGQCQRDGRNINDTLMPDGFQNGRICMRNRVKMVGFMRVFGVFENFISYRVLPCYWGLLVTIKSQINLNLFNLFAQVFQLTVTINLVSDVLFK